MRNDLTKNVTEMREYVCEKNGASPAVLVNRFETRLLRTLLRESREVKRQQNQTRKFNFHYQPERPHKKILLRTFCQWRKNFCSHEDLKFRRD
jgi:hypothetical protein